MGRFNYTNVLNSEALKRRRETLNVEGNAAGTPLARSTIQSSRRSAQLDEQAGKSPITQEQLYQRQAQDKERKHTVQRMQGEEAISNARVDAISDLRKQGHTKLADEAAAGSRLALLDYKAGRGSMLAQLGPVDQAESAARRGFASVDESKAADERERQAERDAQIAHDRKLQLSTAPALAKAHADAQAREDQQAFAAEQADKQRQAKTEQADIDRAFRKDLSESERKDAMERLEYERQSMLELARVKLQQTQGQRAKAQLVDQYNQMQVLQSLIGKMSAVELDDEDKTFLREAQQRFRRLANLGDDMASPPPNAVAALRKDPSLADQFDAKYGEGASKKYIR